MTTLALAAKDAHEMPGGPGGDRYGLADCLWVLVLGAGSSQGVPKMRPSGMVGCEAVSLEQAFNG